MRTDLFLRLIVILTSLVLISWLPALAAEPPPAKTPPSVSTVGQAKVAAGSVEDTLKGCLARIPKGSTGQRMLAEQSCQTAEGARKLDNAAPKF
jgi:hypothetical protein